MRAGSFNSARRRRKVLRLRGSSWREQSRLARLPLQANRKALQIFDLSHFLSGKPVPTFSESALNHPGAAFGRAVPGSLRLQCSDADPDLAKSPRNAAAVGDASVQHVLLGTLILHTSASPRDSGRRKWLSY